MKLFLNKNYFFFLSLFFLFFTLFSYFPRSAYAAACSGSTMGSCNTGESCSCNQTAWQNCTDLGVDCEASKTNCHCEKTPDGQESCNHTICPAGYTCKGSGATSWCDKKTSGSGGCSWSQVNCPPGTKIDLSRPGGKFQAAVSYCPAPGTAQKETGVCIHMTHIPASDCDWVYKKAYDKEFWECKEPAEDICTLREIQNYGCTPISPIPIPSSTPSPTPSPTPTPINTPTPTPPLKCEKLTGQLGGVGGVVITSANTSVVKYGDKVIFTASTNNNGQIVKSITFEASTVDANGATKILNTFDVPATQENGVWTAKYEYLFNTYGKVRIQITTITPQ